jgi:MFS transporter, DHA3 family, macrolide efflux protein
VTTQPVQAVTYRAVLGQRNYFWLWLGQAISQVGDALSIVAIPLLVYQLTHSAMDLTISFLMTGLPWIIIGPFAGVLVDRANRRTVLILTDLIRLFLMLAIFFSHNVPLIYLMCFLSQCMSAIFNPARSAVIPELVGRELYVKAISLSYSTFQITQTVGPFLATGLIAWLSGPRLVILLDSFTFLAAVSTTLLIRFPAHALKAQTPPEASAEPVNPVVSILRSMKEGAVFLWRHPVLRFMTAMSSLRSIATAVILIGCLLYVKNDLGLSADGSDSVYSLVITALSIGTVIGTWWIGMKDKNWQKRSLILSGMMLEGLCLTGMLLHPNTFWLITLFLVAGLFESFAITPVSTSFAEHTPNEVRGRVYSVVNASVQLITMIAYGLVGPIGDTVGASVLLALGGAFLLVVTPVLAWVSRKQGRETQESTAMHS